MSNNYRPDNDATAGDPWNAAFLSDRDVSGQVPINYVPHPGVHLTPACFGNGTYGDVSFKECFSNLLASEFRRFIVDLYWDPLNRKFNLCPVELPSQQNGTIQARSMPFFPEVLAKLYDPARMGHAPLSIRQLTPGNVTSATSTAQRNATLSTATASNISISTSISTSSSIPPVATVSSSNGDTLYQLGPYQCSSDLGLDTVVSVFLDYISQTSDTIQARLQILILNLHAASTIATPAAPPQPLSLSQLPNRNEVVSSYFDQLKSRMYTPLLLHNERENLNTSWFSRRIVENNPLLNYFTVNKLANGELATPDGWPNENYVQLQQGWRILVGYGSVASQINGYDFGGDNTTIFMPGYLETNRNVTLGNSGNVVSGCYYDSSAQQISQINSSWAVSNVMDIDQSVLSYVADNLTVCGISPVLNFTLNNRPASVDYESYQTFGNQALFSWASGEPRNATIAGETANNKQWACALMVSNSDYRGHWRVANCQGKHRVACRQANLPYTWRLSTDAVSYDDGDSACYSNSSFDVPRTGLENLYLYNHIRSASAAQQDSSDLDGIWINFNSLSVDSCWVTTGKNGTCPYHEDPEAVRQRTILVPTIAAFITLVITALTILVKCNTNRRKSKVRKRGEGGWDYEGVPS